PSTFATAHGTSFVANRSFHARTATTTIPAADPTFAALPTAAGDDACPRGLDGGPARGRRRARGAEHGRRCDLSRRPPCGIAHDRGGSRPAAPRARRHDRVDRAAATY